MHADGSDRGSLNQKSGFKFRRPGFVLLRLGVHWSIELSSRREDDAFRRRL